MPTIFSSTINTQRIAAFDGHTQSPRKKRKRVQGTHNAEQELEHDISQKTVKSTIEQEYTAVISPLERLQRRVAGQPLDQLPPPFPFPHSGKAFPPSWTDDEIAAPEITVTTPSVKADETPRTLHLRHLAALTAIVHRSLLREDFARASRALGLLFRADILNRNSAARNNGYIGIGSEVLLRERRPRQGAGGTQSAGHPFAHEAFENAKRFYERLIIKHPYHKSWPGSVNAVDFYLAMFNIWIYVTHTANSPSAAAFPAEGESDLQSPTTSPRVNRTYHSSQVKVRELEQANEIAIRMDTCMATLPYMDEAELIRLRAMVALWIADLHDAVSDSETSFEYQTFSSLSSEPEEETARSEHVAEAKRARDLARDLIERLEGEPRSDE